MGKAVKWIGGSVLFSLKRGSGLQLRAYRQHPTCRASQAKLSWTHLNGKAIKHDHDDRCGTKNRTRTEDRKLCSVWQRLSRKQKWRKASLSAVGTDKRGSADRQTSYREGNGSRLQVGSEERQIHCKRIQIGLPCPCLNEDS